MGVPISLDHLKHVGQQDSFQRFWPHIDTESWPGRELHWAWCHPALAAVLFVTMMIVVCGLVTS